jgi:hypothetical protein
MNTKSKVAIGIVAFIILAGIIFFIFHQSNFQRPQNPPVPGSYITKNQLANVGYNTPEAALETRTWAMMSVNHDKAIESLAPERQAEIKKDPNDRKKIESAWKRAAPLFKGMQIVAKKIIADDKVELKFVIEDTQKKNPGNKYFLQVVVKIGNEWKIGNTTRTYEASWDNNGNVVTFVTQ